MERNYGQRHAIPLLRIGRPVKNDSSNTNEDSAESMTGTPLNSFCSLPSTTLRPIGV